MQRQSDDAGFGTRAVHAGDATDPSHAYVNPIYQTASFRFDTYEESDATFAGARPGYFYTRNGNPSIVALEQKLAALEAVGLDEPVRALAFGSGMAAVSAALLALAEAGGQIISQEALYGVTYQTQAAILPRYGIGVTFVDPSDPAAVARALDEAGDRARAVLLETPINPTLRCIDIAAIAEIAHAHDVLLLVDNTIATPYGQRPLALGADVSVYSTTKFISGHGATIGGALTMRDSADFSARLELYRKNLGAIPGPFDAWLTALGLRTLHVRMERHCANALAVARFLEAHAQVARVYYPGLPTSPDHALAARQMTAFGGMVSFEVQGGVAAARRVLDAVRLCVITPTLGGLDTLITHPATMSHRELTPAERGRMGVSDGLIRLSVGLEDVGDIITDLEQALDRA
jgi:methionine-gamma-lyase